MRLKDVAQVRTNFMGADFWLVRRGGLESIGETSRTFSPYHIGVRVEETRLILPDYLYYVFVHLHQVGQWKPLATGTLSLVHIRTEDVKNIALLMN
ncbi:MAG: Unknown protein [uncultured Thiotrichaceae bacterium]|uniref:Uncharacterized protein n=1 Tax=uncultured Thiotrichaceae bacterium TaxID=298394 RepID=A0A6S6U335_9GAMM|nr:MAG: Unknown protein [uncultured Thiotrichaceae bacterium]